MNQQLLQRTLSQDTQLDQTLFQFDIDEIKQHHAQVVNETLGISVDEYDALRASIPEDAKFLIDNPLVLRECIDFSGFPDVQFSAEHCQYAVRFIEQIK